MDEAFDLELRLKYPKEARIWEAIRRSLKAKSFMEFHMFHGECPPGHELRPKRDGRRAPFDVDHFEWVESSRPKRVDMALKAANEGFGLQGQIDALRARIEALEARAKPEALFAPQAVKTEQWCVIDTGRAIGRFQIERGATGKPGLVSVHSTEDEAQSAVVALINGGRE